MLDRNYTCISPVLENIFPKISPSLAQKRSALRRNSVLARRNPFRIADVSSKLKSDSLDTVCARICVRALLHLPPACLQKFHCHGGTRNRRDLTFSRKSLEEGARSHEYYSSRHKHISCTRLEALRSFCFRGLHNFNLKFEGFKLCAARTRCVGSNASSLLVGEYQWGGVESSRETFSLFERDWASVEIFLQDPSASVHFPMPTSHDDP